MLGSSRETLLKTFNNVNSTTNNEPDLSKSTFQLFFLVIIASCILVSLPAKAEPSTIIVPDDYATIQAAIGNSTQGDTVLVKSGIYYETLVITRSITLIGEGRNTTFIDAGNATENIIYINANNVSVEGFTITNNKGFPTSVPQPDGIKLEYFSSSVSIKNNTISSIQYGNAISLLYGSGNKIEANRITTCGGSGILLEGGEGNSITNNAVVGNSFGTLITYGSHNNTIVGNVFANATGNFGLQLDNDCSNNTVVGNTFATNQYGLALEPPSSNLFYHNNFINNSYQVLLFGNRDDWTGQINSWDNGKEGNYWSDYDAPEIDDSGIGSLPYYIEANWDGMVVYSDNYPLVSPFSNPSDVIPDFHSQTFLLVLMTMTLSLTVINYFKKRKR